MSECHKKKNFLFVLDVIYSLGIERCVWTLIGVSTVLSSAKLEGVGIAGKELVETVGASTMSVSSSVGSARDFLLGLIEEGIMTSSTSSSDGFSCLMLLLVMSMEY